MLKKDPNSIPKMNFKPIDIESRFDEMIQTDPRFSEVYVYLLKFEKEFNNLIHFILNCRSSLWKVKKALTNESNIHKLTLRFIIENREFYEVDCKLNDWELYLTKFITGYSMIQNSTPDKKQQLYFEQVLSITQSQKDNFKYSIDYHKDNYQHSKEHCVSSDWILRLNENTFTVISNNDMNELLEYKNLVSNQSIQIAKSELTLPANQKSPSGFGDSKVIEIQPIKWEKDSVLLAYLFNELQLKGYIKDRKMWKKISSFFIDKDNKPILNTTFPNLITSYGKTKTKSKGKSVPTEHKDITGLMDILNETITKYNQLNS